MRGKKTQALEVRVGGFFFMTKKKKMSVKSKLSEPFGGRCAMPELVGVFSPTYNPR